MLQLKSPYPNGTVPVVMSPLELMQRLAALVPRPRLHLIRFHGVLAPEARPREGPAGRAEDATARKVPHSGPTARVIDNPQVHRYSSSRRKRAFEILIPGWRTADKKSVKNAELWQQLIEAQAPHLVEWHWVRGHAGHAENERADALACAAADAMRG